MEMAKFMASTAGRVGRVIFGLVLIALGVGYFGGVGGWILAVIGLVPIAAGVLNVCLMSPLLGAPFWGAKL